MPHRTTIALMEFDDLSDEAVPIYIRSLEEIPLPLRDKIADLFDSMVDRLTAAEYTAMSVEEDAEELAEQVAELEEKVKQWLAAQSA